MQHLWRTRIDATLQKLRHPWLLSSKWGMGEGGRTTHTLWTASPCSCPPGLVLAWTFGSLGECEYNLVSGNIPHCQKMLALSIRHRSQSCPWGCIIFASFWNVPLLFHRCVDRKCWHLFSIAANTAVRMSCSPHYSHVLFILFENLAA